MRRILLFAGLTLGLVLSIALFNALNFRPRAMEFPQPAKLAIDAQAAAGRLAGALAIPTVSHEDRERMDEAAFLRLHDYLDTQFPRAHRALNRETVSRLSLLYTWPGSEADLDPLLLLAHLDVVPVEPGREHDWQRPPFGGDIADGYVWGRGALDDKASALAQLEAVELLLARGFKPRRTIYLAFGHDEEVGGRDGAARIAELLLKLRVRPALVLDEGGAILRDSLPGLSAPVALVGIAEKGYLSLMLSAEDRGGHSSMPPPSTTVGRVARAVARLEAEPLPLRLTEPARAMLQHSGPHMDFARRFVFANLWLSRPLVLRAMAAQPESNAMVRSTTAASMFSGSPKQNILPARAAAVVNFRILPGETRETVLAHATRVIDDPQVVLSVLPFNSEPSPISPVDSPAYAMLEATIQQSLGQPAGAEPLVVAPHLVVGATDARWYSALSPHVYRFLPLRLTPADLRRIHGANERISVENYAEMVRFYAQLLLNVNAVELK
jgi:carboxypeptidase PM20D1